jgi:hypothetical protein
MATPTLKTVGRRRRVELGEIDPGQRSPRSEMPSSLAAVGHQDSADDGPTAESRRVVPEPFKLARASRECEHAFVDPRPVRNARDCVECRRTLIMDALPPGWTPLPKRGGWSARTARERWGFICSMPPRTITGESHLGPPGTPSLLESRWLRHSQVPGRGVGVDRSRRRRCRAWVRRR